LALKAVGPPVEMQPVLVRTEQAKRLHPNGRTGRKRIPIDEQRNSIFCAHGSLPYRPIACRVAEDSSAVLTLPKLRLPDGWPKSTPSTFGGMLPWCHDRVTVMGLYR